MAGGKKSLMIDRVGVFAEGKRSLPDTEVKYRCVFGTLLPHAHVRSSRHTRRRGVLQLHTRGWGVL